MFSLLEDQSLLFIDEFYPFPTLLLCDFDKLRLESLFVLIEPLSKLTHLYIPLANVALDLS